MIIDKDDTVVMYSKELCNVIANIQRKFLLVGFFGGWIGSTVFWIGVWMLQHKGVK